MIEHPQRLLEHPANRAALAVLKRELPLELAQMGPKDLAVFVLARWGVDRWDPTPALTGIGTYEVPEKLANWEILAPGRALSLISAYVDPEELEQMSAEDAAREILDCLTEEPALGGPNLRAYEPGWNTDQSKV